MEMDEERQARCQAEIEASRRKLAELERDKPSGQAHAPLHAAREEEQVRARTGEEGCRTTAQANAEEAARAKVEEERKAAIERERAARLHRERQRWQGRIPWKQSDALRRYSVLSEEFDKARFSCDDPPQFELIPWPVLVSPQTITIDDVTWQGVEMFFEYAKRCLGRVAYTKLVERSYKRFYPDKWRGRGLLKAITDDATRTAWEQAATRIAQGLSAEWESLR